MPTLSSPTSVSDPVDERSSVTDNNALCYQAIQRIFRNAVVALLRDRMPRVYPSDHVERLKRPFGKEWARTAEHAQYSRQNGGTTTAVRDDYDPLGTNHFYSLFDAYYEKLFSAQAGHPPHLAKPARPRLLGNLKAIKDSRDPLSHPVEEEIPDEEAHHLLLDTRQVLQWLGCEAAAAEIAAVDAKLSRRDMPTITVPRKLPSEDSIYFDFVGRDTLLGELKSSFEKPDDKRCLLAGDGGKGKSAVAYRFAQHLADNPGRFHIIIWLSAKRLKFNGTILPIDSPDFTTIEEAVTRLLVEYGATTQDLQQSLAERKRLLLEYLTEYPAFIIADDIDTVLDDSDIVSLFTHDIPYTPSAVLLTSRRAIPGIRSLVVTGFDADEAAQFVRSRSHLYGLDPRPFTNKVISQVTQATDGSPLYLDDLLKLMRILDVQSAIRVWNDRKGDEARKYALQREMEQLSEDARKVLIAAAISDHPISLAELESILTFSEDRLIGTLMELQTLFLMPQTPVAEGEKRFQINLNTKKLVRSVEGGSDRYLRIEHASKAVTGKLPVVGPGIASSLIRQAQLRINAGKNTDAEKLLSSAIEKYPTVLDLRVFLAVFYKDTGRIADARIQFEKAAKMKTPGADMFIQWAQMEIDRGEWSKAIEAADRGLRIVQDCYRLIEQKVLAQREVGFDFLARNHQERASQTWAEAVDLISRRIKSPEKLPVNDRHLNSSMFCTMVVCLDMLGRHAERNQWLDRWEKENPEDPQLQRQKDELLSKHGTLKASAR
jgi:tetratricopeptide (TPR) repeat protein